MNKKTDIQVQQDVLAELKWEPSVNAADIGVEVKDGIVTLAGHVDNYVEKCGAERVAQRVAGVKVLAVEIDVTLPGPGKRNDADIAHAAANVMAWMTSSPKNKHKAALHEVDAPTCRVWRLYMAACAFEFEAGGTAIYQFLASRRGADVPLPITRKELYS